MNPQSQANKTVLIVDDDEEIRHVLRILCETEGLDVIGEASNGVEAVPLALQHQPDIVIHGHAHAGTFEGRLAEVPVYNVSVPVMKRDFWVFELTGADRRASAIH